MKKAPREREREKRRKSILDSIEFTSSIHTNSMLWHCALQLAQFARTPSQMDWNSILMKRNDDSEEMNRISTSLNCGMWKYGIWIDTFLYEMECARVCVCVLCSGYNRFQCKIIDPYELRHWTVVVETIGIWMKTQISSRSVIWSSQWTNWWTHNNISHTHPLQETFSLAHQIIPADSMWCPDSWENITVSSFQMIPSK